jgi:hypothetical protein
MIALAEVVERFEAEYLARHHPLPGQLQALAAFKRCRTQLAATFTAQCSNDECGAQCVVPHSCGHRLCPHCQNAESQQWIERQRRQLVAGPYFLLTFTLPAELRSLAWAHQRTVYAALMECAWHTLREFARNHRAWRGCPGAVAVLHTHSRALELHPHVHLALPAAALDEDRRLWRRLPPTQRYLFNHKALAKVFRGKLLATLAGEGLSPPPTPERWVVHCKRLDHGGSALLYLGRYLYRGVIQERDILRCDDHGVTYRWRHSKTGAMPQRTVAGAEFLRLLLQHALPKGLRRARSYGFLHPNAKRMAALLRLLVFATPPAPMPKRPQMRCPCCGAVMRVIVRRVAAQPAAAPPRTSGASGGAQA